MKRTISIFLALLMCAGCFTGCSENSSEKETTAAVQNPVNSGEPAAETEDPYNGLTPPPVEDMNGAEMTIMNWNPGWNMSDMFVEEMNGEVLNDSLYEREQTVEDLYNAVLTGLLPETDSDAELMTNSKAGDHLFDVTVIFDADLMDVFNYIRPWDILDIDYSEPWWDRGSVEQFNMYDIQVALTGAFALHSYSNRHCYAFNEDILTNIQPELNIYDEVRESKWTLDRMYELAELATMDGDGDGLITPGNIDYLGISGATRRHYNALIGGAGIRYVDRDEEGNLVFNIPGNEYAVTALSKMAQLNENPNTFQSGSNIVWGLGVSFSSNRVLFQASYVHEVYNMRDLEFNIGVLPPPKYEENQESYYSIVEGGCLCVLPITLTGDDVHKTEVLIEAFTFHSYVKSLDAYIETVLLNKIARSKDSSEMLRLCFDNSFYDMGAGFLTTMFSDTLHIATFMSRKNNVASTLASINKSSEKMLKKVKSTLDKTIVKNMEEAAD